MVAQAVASPEAQWLRGVVKASHAGSWREFPDGRRRAAARGAAASVRRSRSRSCGRRSTGTAAARLAARRCIVIGRRRDREQLRASVETVLAGGAGEQAIVADAVEAASAGRGAGSGG